MLANITATSVVVLSVVTVSLLAEGVITDNIGWAELLQNSPLAAMALATLVGLVWIAKRFCGTPDGIFTKLANNMIECNKINADTLVKLQATSNENAGTLTRLESITDSHTKTLIVLAENLRVMTEKHVAAITELSRNITDIVKRQNKIE